MELSDLPASVALMAITDPIDAFLLVSFGGPEGPDEVIPFLERVTAGRGIPAERLKLVGQHYFNRGGISPINEHCRTLLAEVATAFEDADLDLPMYWGNRNSAPFLDDAVAEMKADGIKHALAFVTSAYSSYSGCRQYRENIASSLVAAGDTAGDDSLAIEKLRVFFNHPGFVEPTVDRITEAITDLDANGTSAGSTHVFFTAHSIPTASAATCDYEQQITNAASLVAERVENMPPWSVVWQSRSGPPQMPWLEPDIVDAISAIDREHVDNVVVVPIGFISDHMEVLQDLDTDAAAAAEAIGVNFRRVSTPSTDGRFVEMIVDLVREKLDGATPVALGELGLVPTQCSESCCPAPQRPTSSERPKRPAQT